MGSSLTTLQVQTILAKITALTSGDRACPQGSEIAPVFHDIIHALRAEAKFLSSKGQYVVVSSTEEEG